MEKPEFWSFRFVSSLEIRISDLSFIRSVEITVEKCKIQMLIL